MLAFSHRRVSHGQLGMPNVDPENSLGGKYRKRMPFVPQVTGSLSRFALCPKGIGLAELIIVMAAIAGVLYAGWAWQDKLLGTSPSSSSNIEQITNYSGLCAVAIAPDQKHVVSVGFAGMLRTHELQTHDCLNEIPIKHCESRCVAYSPDGRSLVVGGAAGHLQLWEFDSNGSSTRFARQNEDELRCCLFHPDSKTFVTGCWDGTLICWNTRTLKPIWRTRGSTASLESASFSSDGKRLVTGDMNGYIRSWDATTGTLLTTCRVANLETPMGHRIVAVRFIPNSDDVLVSHHAGGIEVWELDAGQRKRSFESRDVKFRTLEISRDGKTVVSGHEDGTIAVWETDSGKRLANWPAHSSAVMGIACSDDKSRVASVGWDGQLRVWDL